MKMKIKTKIISGIGALVLCLAGMSGSASDALATEEIHIVIENHLFVPDEIRVKAGTKIKLIVENKDKSAEEFESYSMNREKMIGPGRTVTIFLPKLKPGTYDFFGEFHPDTAKGVIIAEE